MKKLVKLSAVLLAIGLILIGAGAFWAHKDNVNPGSIYSIVEENLKLDGSPVNYKMPQRFDLSSVKNTSDNRSLGYELNEFNTLELYAEKCSIEFVVTQGDTLRANIDGGDLLTGITNGTLYVQAEGGTDCELSISLPESFKGGCTVNAINCEMTSDSIESAMDMSFCLYDSRLTCKMLSADNLTMSVSGSVISAERLDAVDSVRVDAASSELGIKELSAKSETVSVSNTKASLAGISGALTGEAHMSALDLTFAQVTGNISLSLTTCSANVKLPKDADVAFRHEETYGIFTDKTKSAQNASSNEGAAYTMETNIKFGIVTAENK